MNLLKTWHFWTWIFAMYGIQHTVSDIAVWSGLAPPGGLRAGGVHGILYAVATFIPAWYGSAFLMLKTLKEAEKAEE
jgi:hypothetical protein